MENVTFLLQDGSAFSYSKSREYLAIKRCWKTLKRQTTNSCLSGKKKTITSFWGGFKICIDIFPDFLIFSWWFRLIWTSCVTRNSWRKKLPCISFHWIMAIHYVCGSSAWTTFLASFSGSRLQAVRKTDIVVGRGGVLGVSSLSQTIFLSS